MPGSKVIDAVHGPAAEGNDCADAPDIVLLTQPHGDGGPYV
ncbi:MAG: hypothetical protein QM516_13535 [Limnohabitans sp.]|nr:hypothetical protein [Limnohabitans sp.]